VSIEIRVLRRGDEAILENVAEGVFDHPVRSELIREFLADPRHHIAVAIDAGLVVGFASGVHYIHPDAAAQLWVNEVSLAESHRRRGLGKAIMQALFEAGRENGCVEAWVLTYRDNVPAMALYASVGGNEGADDSGASEDLLGYSFDLRQGEDREAARPL